MPSPVDYKKNFAAVPELFNAQIKRSTRNRRIFQVLRNGGAIFFGVGVLGAVSASALAAAGLACMGTVVTTQCHVMYQRWRTKENNLKLVPTGSAQEFIGYLKEQRTKNVVAERLDNISSEFGHRRNRAVVTAVAAAGAAAIGLITGAVFIPIVFGLIVASESADVYKNVRDHKNFNSWRAQRSMDTRGLADLADGFESDLDTTEVIELAEKPETTKVDKTGTAVDTSSAHAENSNQVRVLNAAPETADRLNTVHRQGDSIVSANAGSGGNQGYIVEAEAEAPAAPRRGPRL